MSRAWIAWLLPGLVLALLACRAPSEAEGPQAAPEQPAQVVTGALTAQTAPAVQAPPDPEALRRRAVAAELSKVNAYLIVNDAQTLAERDRALLVDLLEAARLVDELNALQIHPDVPRWRAAVEAQGSAGDQALFARNQHPWCEDAEPPACTTWPEAGARRIGYTHWPEGTDEALLAQAKAAPDARALLSPFTVVRRGEGGDLSAVPFAKDPLLGPRLGKLGLTLRRAARNADHPTLRDFLLTRADAFVADDPFPYDPSDYHWIALEGGWEVTVGPYETYKNPFGIKARFEMVVGRVNQAVTAALAPFKGNLQRMEERVADLVGRELYRPRALDPRIQLRAIDVWMATGDARNPQGALAAYHLPNRGASVDEGLYKKVVLVNHMQAFAPIMKARAQEVLDPALLAYVSGDADILNTTFHELCHGFGAHDEFGVVTPSGERMTVHAALGDLSSLMEELKADVMGLWLVADQVGSGAITADDAKARYVSALMHIFGLLQYAFEGTYPRMVAVQLGWYLDQGAVSYDAASGRWSVDFARMPAAVEALAKKVATLQLTGDRAGAEALLAPYIVTRQGKAAPSDKLAAPLADVAARFAAKGLKSVSISYEIKGL